MKKHPDFQEHFRPGQIGMKRFNALNKEERNQYLKSLLDLPVTERTTVDCHILRWNNMLPEQPTKHFFSIEE